ncbi:MAG: DUF3575 domain-containing protein [Bacteroidales bacterium]
MNKFNLSVLCLVLFHSLNIAAQKIAVKTNLLYGGITLTPNLGAEISIAPRWTLDLSGGYNPWNLHGSISNNKKLVHWLVEPEVRYWLCQKFSGHFFGTHLLFSQYNISQHRLPWLLGKGSQNYRYEGNAAGGGLTYGYQFILGNHWNLEASIGIGYARLWYDKFNCLKCGEKLESSHRNYFGPTKAAISIVYLIK